MSLSSFIEILITTEVDGLDDFLMHQLTVSASFFHK